MGHRDLDIEKYSGVYHWGDKYHFPLWNLSGEMVGYQVYTPTATKVRKKNPRDMRYFTYLPKYAMTAWGLELLNPHQKYLLVVEGIFDAIKLHNLGVNCLAVLGSDSIHLKSWLHTLNHVIVPVCEGDKAGRRLAKLATTDLIEQLPEGVDVGNMSRVEVHERFRKYL